MNNFEIDPGIVISKLDIKDGDTIVVTIDTDKWDLDEVYNMSKIMVNSFPNNKVIFKLKGIEISGGAGSSPK